MRVLHLSLRLQVRSLRLFPLTASEVLASLPQAPGFVRAIDNVDSSLVVRK